MSSQTIVVYTDGSALGNPGQGGWAWYITPAEHGSGHGGHTTNNIMELTAIANAIQHIDLAYGPHVNIEIRSDSDYSIKACSQWIHGWKRNNWRTAAGKPVANQDIITRVDQLTTSRSGIVRYTWVKAHNGEPGNEAVDTLARTAAGRPG